MRHFRYLLASILWMVISISSATDQQESVVELSLDVHDSLGWQDLSNELVMHILSQGVNLHAFKQVSRQSYQQALMVAAHQGNAAAQCSLGVRYEKGRGVGKDDEQAVEWYRKAAEQGHADAQCTLGWMYANGSGVEQDDEQAVEWFRKAANQGDTNAQFSLGWAYAIGLGVKKDDEQAVEWYRKAAEQDRALAQCSLGVMYANGSGVEQDDEQAVEWFRKAANQGDTLAQYNLGWMYEHGRGVEKDDEQAVEWFRKAANRGHANAQYNLGVRYEHGRGVEKDDKLAVQWWKNAAEQGNANAQFNLGVMYANGRGVEKDDKLAVQWWKKAAEQGNANAQFNLGVMYANGCGVEKDDKLAVQWWKNAAKQGDAAAQYFLGWMYEKGRGVNRDEIQAFRWYFKAVQQGETNAQEALPNACYQAALKGDAEAQYQLALLYKAGTLPFAARKFFRSNLDCAQDYLLRAVEQGHKAARTELGWLYASQSKLDEALHYLEEALEAGDAKVRGLYEQQADKKNTAAQLKLASFYIKAGPLQDYVLARKWYERIATSQHSQAKEAAYYLVQFYTEGLGVQVSPIDAVKWCKAAVQLGHTEACYELGMMYESGYGIPFKSREEKNKALQRSLAYYKRAKLKGDSRADKDIKRLKKAIKKILPFAQPQVSMPGLLRKVEASRRKALSKDQIDAFLEIANRLEKYDEEVQGTGLYVLKELSFLSESSTLFKVIVQNLLEAICECASGQGGWLNAKLTEIGQNMEMMRKPCFIPAPQDNIERGELIINQKMIQDPRINLYKAYFVTGESYNTFAYSRAVKSIMALFDRVVRDPGSELLYADDKGRYATRTDLEKLLKNGIGPVTPRFAHRVINIAEILKLESYDDSFLATQLSLWAVAGIECNRRKDAELDGFYSACITNSQFLHNESSTLETRVALSLAKLRDALIEELVPAEEEERVHAIGILKKKVGVRLGLIGDHENLVDHLARSFEEPYYKWSDEEIITKALNHYTPERMVEWIWKEVNKASADSTIPYMLLQERLEHQQPLANYRGAQPMIKDFYDDSPSFTRVGAEALLVGLGYLKREDEEF